MDTGDFEEIAEIVSSGRIGAYCSIANANPD
jgi:hypothetical protein